MFKIIDGAKIRIAVLERAGQMRVTKCVERFRLERICNNFGRRKIFQSEIFIGCVE
jgi:hypothetical protein